MARSRKTIASGIFFGIGIISLLLTTDDRLWCLLVAVISFVIAELLRETTGCYGK